MVAHRKVSTMSRLICHLSPGLCSGTEVSSMSRLICQVSLLKTENRSVNYVLTQDIVAGSM